MSLTMRLSRSANGSLSSGLSSNSHRIILQRQSLARPLHPCYSTQNPASNTAPSTQPTSTTDSNDKGPKTLVTPPEPPIEYSRKPRELSSLSKNPWVVRAVRLIAPLMGYYSTTTTAIRETRAMYALCGERVEVEQDFLYKECALPPTFQTWFQFTLLHVLILNARLRALPPSISRAYQAELVNHFFLDIEHRMRAILGTKVPERIVTGYMKEMRDQWRGGGVAFDLGVVGSDATLAGMIWRNLYASRGAIPPAPESDQPGKRKLVDASPQEVDLPAQLYKFVAHIRRELTRLETLSDEDVALGKIGKWGEVGSIRMPEDISNPVVERTIVSGQKQAATA